MQQRSAALVPVVDVEDNAVFRCLVVDGAFESFTHNLPADPHELANSTDMQCLFWHEDFKELDLLGVGDTTTDQPIGETLVLVEAPRVKGVGIDSSTSAHTDDAGLVIANYVQSYWHKCFNLNTSTLGSEVELEDTSMQVVPRCGAIVHARFNAEFGRRVQFELSLANVEKIPMGAVAVDQDGKSLGVVDNMSRLLVFGIKEAGQLMLEWQNNLCTADYKLPEKDPKNFYDRINVVCR